LIRRVAALLEPAAAQGVRTGNWLTKHQAEQLINRPDTGTLKGRRDRAILAVTIG
jgi:hypothetical protein